MIARLKGTVIEKRPGVLVVDVGGVGYEVSVPLTTYREIGEAGGGIELQVHTHARDGALALFGFSTRLEKEVFTRLIDVNGVGPRMAIAVLSGLGARELIAAVCDRDARRLATVPGIGRKTADRILLELADRLDDLVDDAAGSAAGVRGGPGTGALRQDLISALVNLGYNARVAARTAGEVLEREPGQPPFETLLRQTLKRLSR
jgi:Holliday junction DNA helicase RuvA